MRVLTNTKPAFKPVTIILETQEEVNDMFCLLVHVDLTTGTSLDGAWRKLDGKQLDYNANFIALEARMKKAYPKSIK